MTDEVRGSGFERASIPTVHLEWKLAYSTAPVKYFPARPAPPRLLTRQCSPAYPHGQDTYLVCVFTGTRQMGTCPCTLVRREVLRDA